MVKGPNNKTDPTPGKIISQQVSLPIGGVILSGEISFSHENTGWVIFAHGSGSSRLSPRNQFVARHLNQAGLGTLLFDLLTLDEETADAESGNLRFNIEFLGNRLSAATKWFEAQRPGPPLPVGFFGASTGAAAALIAAADLKDRIQAVVSRGGRPDLALSYLQEVTAATLLLVGARDTLVLELNRKACAALPCEKQLEVIPGATHLFPEPGALEKVAHLASAWFLDHFKNA